MKRNQISHQVRRRARSLKEAQVHWGIGRAPGPVKVFDATRKLLRKDGGSELLIHDSHGAALEQDTGKAEAVRKQFPLQFDTKVDPLQPFSPRPLQSPVLPVEVMDAFKKLKNNRACGPDPVPGELLKHSP